MARKKLSEMTPYQRIESRMNGLSWEEAEDVGVEVLGRCMALHAYARKDGEEYLQRLMKRICERGDKWAHEGNNSIVLAFAAAGYEREKELEELNELNKRNYDYRESKGVCKDR